MIEKIAKLLALAENASTPAEAEAAFAKAQHLATTHAIDLELARRAAAPKQRETPTKRTIRIGEKGKHVNSSLVDLFHKVADANDVKALQASNLTYVIPHGLPSDLDAVEAIWASLATAMVRLCSEHVDAPDAPWRSETVRVWSDRDWTYTDKPVTKQGARKSFYQGFVSRIAVRLMEAREASIKQADDHFHNNGQPVAAVTGSSDANLPSSMAVALREKRAEVADFMYSDFKQQYGHAPRAARRSASSARRSSSSRAAGRAAADRVDLGGRRSIAS